MNHKTYEYGIITQNVLLRDLTKKGNSTTQRTALLGTIVKIESILADKKLGIRFLKDDSETWESTSYYCDQNSIVSVHENFWPFLAAVASPLERVKLAKHSDRCERLLNITKDAVVGFLDEEVHLGTVKYIGTIKGLGKGYGIQLHEKKRKNSCDGSCAGIQYFHCLPGFGLFTTAERIMPQPAANITISKPNRVHNDLEACVEQNVSKINNKNETRSYRTSVSLQNIVQPVNKTVNTNNDFDQNTIIQPDDLYLVDNKVRTEVDLVDVIGGEWSGKTDPKHLETYSNLGKSLKKSTPSSSPEKVESCLNNVTLRSPRNRSMNPFLHLVNGSKTLPRKSKLFQESPEIKKIDNKFNSANDRPTKYEPPDPGTTNELTIGTLIEVSNDVAEDPLYGVIRWMGRESTSKHVLIGVELEEEQSHLPLTLTDGTHNGHRFFKCSSTRALFVPLSQCHKDSRFQDGAPVPVQRDNNTFGRDCPVIPGAVAPLCMPSEEDVEAVCGKFRGIQGHHNSCYLDATLFAMFTFTAVFDSLLYRPKGPNDISHYEEVQRVLREEIVNPLRMNLFVRADRVMNLRKLLDQLSSVTGLTSEEKDPEEFLNSLLAQILKAEPFLKLNSGQEAYHYQLFVEKDDGLSLPTVQQLFEQSFLTSDIKLKEVPSCLIIQMPRFGKNYKMYPRIVPSQLLDVTDIIENSPRQCTVCGKLAKWECKECFGECGVGLESTAFCTVCLEKAHSHSRRSRHSPKSLSVSPDFSIMEEHCPPPRLFMELFAVVCIETSHYVAFVKCGVGHEAPWCFFDSMADRKGEQNGYNIPEMVACPDVSKWLSDEQICRLLHENAPADRYLPEHARRLLCDAYICMYQSPDVMMYR